MFGKTAGHAARDGKTAVAPSQGLLPAELVAVAALEGGSRALRTWRSWTSVPVQHGNVGAEDILRR